jgi:hypothetical protein
LGANHSAYPLRFFDRDSGIAWLRSSGLEIPTPLPLSRDPTQDELRMVLDNLPGCRVEYRMGEGGFDADICNSAVATDWAVICVDQEYIR